MGLVFQLNRKKTLTIIMILIIIGMLGISFLLIGFSIEMGKQIAYRDRAEEALGFGTGTPYVNGSEVFMITEVHSNSSMDRAGGMEGDIIIDKTIGEFFEDIYQARGTNYSFNVNRNERKIQLIVHVPYFEAEEFPGIGSFILIAILCIIPTVVVIILILIEIGKRFPPQTSRRGMAQEVENDVVEDLGKID